LGDVPLRTFVIVDIGCRLDGYCSDCTRTFATGALSEEAAAVYAVVLDAHHAAVEAVRAGVAGRAADAVARERIAAGYGEEFGHGLGHRVGLEVHEGPRLSPTSDDELAAGNVVTVEPGICLSGRARRARRGPRGGHRGRLRGADPKTLVTLG
jgi:Xaa-Pro aminopeptidase